MPISPVGPVTATVRPCSSPARAYPPGRPGPLRCHSTWPSPSAARAALDVVPLVQHPLQAGDALGWVGGDLGGELERRLLGRGRRRDPVDEAEAQRLVGADRARGEQQVLGGGEAAEGDQAGRADRDAERGAREAHPQVGAADPHVAGDRDLGAAADDVAVAGGDRRLREGDDLRRRRRRRAASARPCSRSSIASLMSAPAERPMWSEELITRTRTASSSRATARCSSISSSIWVSIALRASGRSQPQQRDPLLVDLVAGAQLAQSSLMPRNLAARRAARPRRRRGRSARRPRRGARGTGRARRRRRSRDRSSRAARPRPGPARSRAAEAAP